MTTRLNWHPVCYAVLFVVVAVTVVALALVLPVDDMVNRIGWWLTAWWPITWNISMTKLEGKINVKDSTKLRVVNCTI